ncbi:MULTISPECIES: RDD family protein [unclassified Streptomyces]|uniref:RDD family protein n=1 Tax=unclassified Streptomyces TaxID=2593676 RepID=UPI001BE81465|nr:MULTISPECIES: RDD family protein [unclassified Streptomyces]MBT2406151.1 RDD family protein [Streptomyces sp. ISL-21]MBT2459504.1 RDD family protein [Streptomyces sp. ISL-86]MBT2609209.1 RDD family protein [Streptomyces sp. ISL-87]
MSFGDPNNPYGQQPPQGQPGYPQGQPGYPQQAPQGVPQQYGYPQQTPPPPYGAYPPAGMPGMPGAGMPPLAHWGQRVGAYLLDFLITIVPLYVLVGIGQGMSDDPDDVSPLGLIGLLYTIGMVIFQLVKEGSTGQTIGKKVLGISLLREADGRTLGFGMALVRKLAHFLDSAACYVGWLWPLWDDKKQTFADKVCSTVVIQVNKG